jgi:hypothetical protein
MRKDIIVWITVCILLAVVAMYVGGYYYFSKKENGPKKVVEILNEESKLVYSSSKLEIDMEYDSGESLGLRTFKITVDIFENRNLLKYEHCWTISRNTGYPEIDKLLDYFVYVDSWLNPWFTPQKGCKEWSEWTEPEKRSSTSPREPCRDSVTVRGEGVLNFSMEVYPNYQGRAQVTIPFSYPYVSKMTLGDTTGAKAEKLLIKASVQGEKQDEKKDMYIDIYTIDEDIAVEIIKDSI